MNMNFYVRLAIETVEILADFTVHFLVARR